ncbi:MAG: glycosyltransferase family 39 protein [Verrucomicrobiota bacterium]|nr:glycosyltransferase family 39 protein [Verrucomicrobiota bacterium]
MPGPAEFVQRTVHALEAGGAAVWVRRGLGVVLVLGIALFYLIHEFRGLATSQAMDQAQIGRNIANGEGFKTDMIRPLAIGQLQRAHKDVPQRIWSDTYNAPLPPLVDAIALRPIKSSWKMTPRDVIYAGDKIIAFVTVCIFLASVVILFFIARRLFDDRLAILGCALVLVCDTLWQYSLSGLPQMLMLFIFNATLYALVRALQAQTAGGAVGLWLAGVGAGFGLLALSHALTIWIFLGALIFIFFYFKPRGWAGLIVLGCFLVLYTPWLIRNWVVCGNPGGVAVYSFFDGVNHSEAGHMRRLAVDLEGVGTGFYKNKITGNLITQMGRLFESLGWSAVALTFFVSLLHLFRRKETAILRWMVLAMWGGAVLGMAVYGVTYEQGVAANQLHILFIPIMTCYGLAYLLVQWNRLEIRMQLARIGFITGLVVICGLPMILALVMPTPRASVRWPPYIPPFISVINTWMKPNEVVASDIPWAVSWYADRRSIWLPESIATFTEFHDYGVVGAPLNGLYLTPVSGSSNNLGDILKGEYRDWAPVILRSIDLQKFPLRWATLLGLEGECVFFADTDRQKLLVP